MVPSALVNLRKEAHFLFANSPFELEQLNSIQFIDCSAAMVVDLLGDKPIIFLIDKVGHLVW